MGLRKKIQSALYTAIQEETDAVMAVVREELSRVHEPDEFVPGHFFCTHCKDGDGNPVPYPCPTMKIVEDS